MLAAIHIEFPCLSCPPQTPRRFRMVIVAASNINFRLLTQGPSLQRLAWQGSGLLPRELLSGLHPY